VNSDLSRGTGQGAFINPLRPGYSHHLNTHHAHPSMKICTPVKKAWPTPKTTPCHSAPHAFLLKSYAYKKAPSSSPPAHVALQRDDEVSV
jgi:hypothetical protein